MLGMLGLCARAGRLITGEKACIQAVRSGAARVVLLDGAASDNAVGALSRACATHAVPLLRTEPDELGRAIGRPSRMAAAVTDGAMARRIIALSIAEGRAPEDPEPPVGTE